MQPQSGILEEKKKKRSTRNANLIKSSLENRIELETAVRLANVPMLCNAHSVQATAHYWQWDSRTASDPQEFLNEEERILSSFRNFWRFLNEVKMALARSPTQNGVYLPTSKVQAVAIPSQSSWKGWLKISQSCVNNKCKQLTCSTESSHITQQCIPSSRVEYSLNEFQGTITFIFDVVMSFRGNRNFEAVLNSNRNTISMTRYNTDFGTVWHCNYNQLGNLAFFLPSLKTIAAASPLLRNTCCMKRKCKAVH